MLFCKMFVEMFVSGYLLCAIFLLASRYNKKKKGKKKEEILFQGKRLSMENMDPNCRMGPPEASGQKKLKPDHNLGPSVQPVRETETVDHLETPGGL